MFDTQVEDGACLGDSLIVHDIEFTFGEWGCDLVFDHFDAGPVASHLTGRVFDLADTADIDTDRAEEFQGPAAGGGFRAPEHDPDFFADLVGKDTDALAFADRGGEAAHGLAHHTCLEADGGVSHLAIEFHFGDEGGDGVHDDHIDGSGADEGFGDIEGIFA